MKTTTVKPKLSNLLSLASVGLIAVSLGVGAKAEAVQVTHSAQSFVGALTPPFGPLTAPVGTFFTDKGVDYTFGNTEGVFNDGNAKALCGINGSGICDLLTDVDGRIVSLNTTVQGLTSFLSVEAGFAANGSLTLTAFDLNFAPIASVLNGFPLGPNGRTTMTINRGGIFDIAFFRISGGDTYGVNTVTIEEPISSQPVPEPTSILGLVAIGLIGTVSLLKRELQR